MQEENCLHEAREGESLFHLFFSLAFVVAIAASTLIKRNHINHWCYLLHVRLRIWYALVAGATTLATGAQVLVGL